MPRPRLYTPAELRERQNAARRLARAGRRRPPQNHVVEPRDPPPPAVIAERERVATQPRTLTEILMGDPPPGRRAIDMRGSA